MLSIINMLCNIVVVVWHLMGRNYLVVISICITKLVNFIYLTRRVVCNVCSIIYNVSKYIYGGG